ncbi:unnamed protein product [Effrenium voratum]|uniref:Uncharacterized protein n=1 Tax=Effrenium voratum TaxID=2562239 RepID=A0AA36NIG7_9DINO|nr:unnamed protein product [Effrenium voratum]CAJ1438665.1 unnamed protein product [Effrenium voratum]
MAVDEPAVSMPAGRIDARGGVAWKVRTGAKPASARPKAEPRPPKWEASAAKATYGRAARKPGGAEVKSMTEKRLQNFKAKQAETLHAMRSRADKGAWDKLHNAHFDWWAFPIDDGSKPDFNISSEADVDVLRNDAEWLEGYHEALSLACHAWGWDLAAQRRIDPLSKGMGWTDWDVRLAKMCRSVYLFEEVELLASLQKFAREVQAKEKEGKSFFYGMICLDELLYFELPRRPGATGASCPEGAQPEAVSDRGASDPDLRDGAVGP